MNWKRVTGIGVVLGVVLFWIIPLPDPLFKDPYATTLESSDGQLLGARIASDGQWRFPPLDSLPENYSIAVITLEDKRFYRHWGIDLLALARAIRQNLKAGRVVSGGSTLTMQLARMARGNRDRNLWQKLIECWMALRLEAKYSKDEILLLYANHAPFGGNVVGLHAASWRYFERSPFELSTSESASLAVLPNAPGIIYPGKEDAAYETKRNRLLAALLREDKLDSMELKLYSLEPVPKKPARLPRHAPHLLDRVVREQGEGVRLRSTLDFQLQNQVNSIIGEFHRHYKHQEVHNLAAVVIDLPTGNVLAYTGNSSPDESGIHGENVDVITSKRSPGSLIKPFLYARALDEGLISPGQMLADIPTYYRGFAPKNFNKSFKGAVPASEALSLSLNVPFVRLLREYGYHKLHHELRGLGLESMDRSADHYGLTMVLGGAETTLWELTSAYAGLGRTLLEYDQNKGRVRYADDLFRPNQYSEKESEGHGIRQGKISAGSAWHTLQAMQELIRPNEHEQWQRFNSSRSISWKTGTSFGHKDAWAIGLDSRYVVGIWVGNADGEGRPDLTGVQMAAPVLFRIFKQLPRARPFPRPLADMQPERICQQSGFRADHDCPETTLEWIVKSASGAPVCPHHRVLNLDNRREFQVHSLCYPVRDMINASWFILPPSMAMYYKKSHPGYSEPPEWKQTCETGGGNNMELIYPQTASKIYVPVEVDGSPGRVIFQAAHANPESEIYWHLDNDFMGTTKEIHKLGLYPDKGAHRLSLVDGFGETLTITFEILNDTGREVD